MRGLLLLILPLPLYAQTDAMAVFPPQASCFQRQYDAAHLAKHPQQQVTDIALTPAAGQEVSMALVVDVSVNMRARSETYVGSAYCEPDAAALSCGMEGDAGAFSLMLRNDGALLLKVSPLGISFEGAQDFVTISGIRGDDRTFLMQPVPATDCP